MILGELIDFVSGIAMGEQGDKAKHILGGPSNMAIIALSLFEVLPCSGLLART